MKRNADNAERKVRQWALRRNGDPLTNHDIVDLVFALADDHDADHAETLTLLEAHCKEADRRDERIESLEEWREESQATCVDRVKRLIDEEHSLRHTAHLESDHPEDNDFRTQLVWFFASNAGKVVIFLAGGAALALMNYLLYGRP